tara:strand:- start:665 stop:1018 length:354 start_codon:yes stop_codon:yes gene_type:complete
MGRGKPVFSDSLNKRKRGAKPLSKISIKQLAFNQGSLRKFLIIQQYHSDDLKKRQPLVTSVTLQLAPDVGFLQGFALCFYRSGASVLSGRGETSLDWQRLAAMIRGLSPTATHYLNT